MIEVHNQLTSVWKSVLVRSGARSKLRSLGEDMLPVDRAAAHAREFQPALRIWDLPSQPRRHISQFLTINLNAYLLLVLCLWLNPDLYSN